MEAAIVWKGRANSIFIQLSKDGTVLTPEEIDLITAVELRYKGVYYGSLAYPTYFDLTTYRATGQIAIKPGLLPMPVGEDVVELIIYDSVNTDGIMWMQISVEVKGDVIR